MNVWKNEGMKVPVKSWCPEAEQGAIDQINQAAELPFVFRHVAMMPDAHAGYGVPIGSVIATRGIIIPFFVGVDIGCGMMAVKTELTEIDEATLKEIMGQIREAVPVGFNHHKEPHEWEGFDRAPDIKIIQDELKSARCQLGTLGGGNHFIEIQRGDDGYVWIMLHSGSRNFGYKTAKVYHERAKELCERWYSAIPHKDLSFLPMDSMDGQEYFAAMNYCLEFAAENRAEMMRSIARAFFKVTSSALPAERINVHHNYAIMEHHFGTNVMVHRKGAIRAYEGQLGIIPGSMGTASYITEGKGNDESFKSSSHGAGRRMGRKDATRSLILEDEQAKMAGIVHGLRAKSDLDEAPGAYKPILEVMNNQADLARILVTLRPLANIKG